MGVIPTCVIMKHQGWCYSFQMIHRLLELYPSAPKIFEKWELLDTVKCLDGLL